MSSWCLNILSVVILIVPSTILGINQDNDYWCEIQSKYCEGREHIGCEPNKYPYNKEVTNITLIPITVELKKFIVDKHNYYRNRVASGAIKDYPSSSKMNQMGQGLADDSRDIRKAWNLQARQVSLNRDVPVGRTEHWILPIDQRTD